MAQNTPPRDEGLFGTLFDLNGDGRTDVAEAALMCMLFDEMQKKEECKRQAQEISGRSFDLDDLDIVDGLMDLDDMDIKGI